MIQRHAEGNTEVLPHTSQPLGGHRDRPCPLASYMPRYMTYVVSTANIVHHGSACIVTTEHTLLTEVEIHRIDDSLQHIHKETVAERSWPNG